MDRRIGTIATALEENNTTYDIKHWSKLGTIITFCVNSEGYEFNTHSSSLISFIHVSDGFGSKQVTDKCYDWVADVVYLNNKLNFLSEDCDLIFSLDIEEN